MEVSKVKRTYWDTFEGSYQMGAQKHRLYMLDLLRVKGVETLLDVGMGTAPIFDLIINSPEARWDNIRDYKGTDYSWAMVDIAKEMFPHGKFEVQDARALKEPDNSWDCILLMHALDHLDDYQAAIREAARVAKKYVCIILWRPFIEDDPEEGPRNNLNPKNTYGKTHAEGNLLPGEKPWEDTYLQEYSHTLLEDEFKKNNLIIDHIAEGDLLNSDASKYNFLYLLHKG